MRPAMSPFAPTVLLVGLLTASVGFSEEEPPAPAADPVPLLEQFRARAAAEDAFAALDYLEGLGDPKTVAEAYLTVTQALHDTAKDLSAAIWAGQAGIRYCLASARESAEAAPREAAALRETARVLAYNLASNAWPAWETEGITPTPDDMRAGLDAAKLNLRLTRELGLGPGAEAAAHWMLGAHYLAAREPALAAEAFKACEERSTDANEPAAASMAKGYSAIVRVLTGEADAGRADYDAALAELGGTDNDEARFYHDQLERALAFFTR